MKFNFYLKNEFLKYIEMDHIFKNKDLLIEISRYLFNYDNLINAHLAYLANIVSIYGNVNMIKIYLIDDKEMLNDIFHFSDIKYMHINYVKFYIEWFSVSAFHINYIFTKDHIDWLKRCYISDPIYYYLWDILPLEVFLYLIRGYFVLWLAQNDNLS